MQLKRDTDYAIRLLIKLCEKTVLSETAVSIRDLCSETGVPCMIASRIMESLKTKGIVCSLETDKNKVGYYLNENAGQVTLYELISVIEGRAELFAAFNKSNPAYCFCREKLVLTESEVKNCLSNVVLADLIKNIEKTP